MTDIAEARQTLQKYSWNLVLDAIEKGLDPISIPVALDGHELPTQYIKLNPDMTWHRVDK